MIMIMNNDNSNNKQPLYTHFFFSFHSLTRMFSSSTLKWPFLEFENLANNIKCDVGNNERSLRTMSKMKMMTVEDNDDDNDNASLISLC